MKTEMTLFKQNEDINPQVQSLYQTTLGKFSEASQIVLDVLDT